MKGDKKKLCQKFSELFHKFDFIALCLFGLLSNTQIPCSFFPVSRLQCQSDKHNVKWSFVEICWVVKQTGTNMGLQRHFTVNSLSNSNNYLTHMTSFHAMFRQHLWHLKVSNISLDQHLNLAKEDILKLTACILDIYQYMCKCEL